MKFLLVIGGLLSAGLVLGAVQGAGSSQQLRGMERYEYWCATCHGKETAENGRNRPGTASLIVKYGKERPGALEDRTDLLPPYTKLIIRRGTAGMPSFRKTEISDLDMEDIAAYLARNVK